VKEYEDVREYIRGRYIFNIGSLETVSSDDRSFFGYLERDNMNLTIKRHRSQ
jgi:hypothetical protein